MHSQDNSCGMKSKAEHTIYKLNWAVFLIFLQAVKFQAYCFCWIIVILTVDFDGRAPDQRAGGETCQHHGSRHLVHVHLLLWPSVETEEEGRISLGIFFSQYIITPRERLWRTKWTHIPMSVCVAQEHMGEPVAFRQISSLLALTTLHCAVCNISC